MATPNSGNPANKNSTPTFSGGIRDKVATTPADRGSNTNRVAGVISKVGDYLGNVARSARDLPTAAGTLMDTPMLIDARLPKITKPGAPLINAVSQVAQTIGAVGGRKDNDRSDQYSGGRTRATAEGHVSYGKPGAGRGAGRPTPKFAINEAAPRPTGKAKPKNGGKENSQVK
jgi:hypothetical protein